MKTCKFCGAKFEKQGQLNLHQYHCKIKHINKDSEHYPNSQNDRSSKNGDIDICSHNYRLLNLKIPIEKRAYGAGYKEVCVKCQELH